MAASQPRVCTPCCTGTQGLWTAGLGPAVWVPAEQPTCEVQGLKPPSHLASCPSAPSPHPAMPRPPLLDSPPWPNLTPGRQVGAFWFKSHQPGPFPLLPTGCDRQPSWVGCHKTQMVFSAPGPCVHQRPPRVTHRPHPGLATHAHVGRLSPRPGFPRMLSPGAVCDCPAPPPPPPTEQGEGPSPARLQSGASQLQAESGWGPQRWAQVCSGGPQGNGDLPCAHPYSTWQQPSSVILRPKEGRG